MPDTAQEPIDLGLVIAVLTADGWTHVRPGTARQVVAYVEDWPGYPALAFDGDRPGEQFVILTAHIAGYRLIA